MTDKRQRFSTSEIVESLKETGSRVRSVASEFSDNAAENYRARGTAETVKNAARQTVRDFRGIESFEDAKDTGEKLWKRGKHLGREFSSGLSDAVGKTRNSEAARKGSKGATGEHAGTTNDGRPRIIEGEVIDVDGQKVNGQSSSDKSFPRKTQNP